MTPTIGASRETIRLELSATISEFIETKPVANILPPKIESRVSSSVTVPDGQIFVIGGLTRTGRAGADEAGRNNLYLFLRAHVLTGRPGD
jgi:type II secretory pathway component GspD/PulD (secretin)